MIVATPKRRYSLWESGMPSGRFHKGHDYDWAIDFDTHKRRIAKPTTRAERTIPVKFEIAIESSKCLLDLGIDWDDAGALPINRDTWKRATDLVRRTIVKIGISATSIPVPNISPCADGSIDIFWKKNSRFTLLVNIQPMDANSGFYGEDADGLTFEGTFTNKTRDFSRILGPLLD